MTDDIESLNRPITIKETEKTVKDPSLKNASHKEIMFFSDPHNFILVLIKLG